MSQMRQANVQQAVPFFLVADMQRSVRFYVDGLGFTITHNGRSVKLPPSDTSLLLRIDGR